MHWMVWIGVTVGAVALFFVGQLIYLSAVLYWGDQQTRGLGYYGLPPDERERFKATLRRHARLLFPILRMTGWVSRFSFKKTNLEHRGLAGPQGTCSAESFARADDYQPQTDDVFVVTPMKCGTTWMQHVVYETLCRGGGDLVEAGHTLYRVSPWLESLKSVPIDEAPLVGTERPSRVIKTHLPVSHCPYSADARYIYVARHPVSCFASCVDFIATNLGAFGPPLDVIEEWFCSDKLMWWGPWPDHVTGWWERSRSADNVLFVRFEEMKEDLDGVVRRVADFLQMAPLTERELARVVEKCGFAYMQRHHHAFEMAPPHLLAVDAELFVRGTADRHRDVPDDTRRRIAAWCAARLGEGGFPMAEIYPDVTRLPG